VKGRLWLRQRFPDEYHVEVHPHLAPCERPTTTRVVVAPSVHGVRGQDDIVVHLDYPVSWFSEHTPVDGLLGVRVIVGFLEAIKGTSRKFGMQGPQLKTPCNVNIHPLPRAGALDTRSAVLAVMSVF
jgi:hypothetical protein